MGFKDKVCEICGDTFSPVSPRQLCCSEQCQKDRALLRQRKYYRKHKKERIAKQTELNTANAEERKAYMKEYSQTETFKKAKRRHYQQNKEYYHQKVREFREKQKREG